ncbi:MAG: M14 family zinc carboxypeptidase [Candidatus Marinimicrobia bacterium]|nr:M14 family zinc carboxypeptidase [Candidatus Neomarinimicrobiota bacterium]
MQKKITICKTTPDFLLSDGMWKHLYSGKFRAVRLILIILAFFPLFASEPIPPNIPEFYFRFKIENQVELERLTRMISIDNVRNLTVYAYANRKEFASFSGLGYAYEILPHPGKLIESKTAKSAAEMSAWTSYPTYETYLGMMNRFATDHPDLCQIVSAGTSVNGRQILFAKISNHVDTEEAEPEVMLTSTMHGDEVVGYVLMLRLIDYLLTNYATDSRITNLLDSTEIWINPLANPDGTYAGGNSTVFGATRYNSNSIDLNRNFPDPAYGDHPDGEIYQPETSAMVSLAETHHFVLSANFHGGAEVVNYPWETWSRLHTDDAWFQSIAHQYADTAQQFGRRGYFNDVEFNDGITNGYCWYPVHGGRQDFMTYFQNGREVTIEISDIKMPATSTLDYYWEANYRSLIHYLENAQFGIRGIVTDPFGTPLNATITLIGHDADNSEVVTDSDVGDYYRLCSPGTFRMKIESDGFLSEEIDSVVITADRPTIQKFQLKKDCIAGDVNQDGSIDVTDLLRVIRFSLNRTQPDEQEKFPADWNADGNIDRQDIMGIVNVILNSSK